MGFIPFEGMPNPGLSRENLAVRIAELALRVNEKLLAERKPRKRRKAA